MTAALPAHAQEQIFTKAHSHRVFLDKPLSDEDLKAIYELAKWAPTSANCMPMRVLFLKSKPEKAKLLPALMGNNAGHVESAPVTAIIAYDEKFYDRLPELFPAFDARAMFLAHPASIEPSALRNSSLQGAYVMLAARMLGFDVGPMSGFDNRKVDEIFFNGTNWKSNFLCNIGYGDASKLYPRGPRLAFEDACKIA